MQGDRDVLHPEDETYICHPDIGIHEVGFFTELGKHCTEIDRNRRLSRTSFP